MRTSPGNRCEVRLGCAAQGGLTHRCELSCSGLDHIQRRQRGAAKASNQIVGDEALLTHICAIRNGDFHVALKCCAMRSSTSRKDDCWGNAPIDSLWSRLKVVRMHGKKFARQRQAMDGMIDNVMDEDLSR